MVAENAAIETRGLTKVYPGFWSANGVPALVDLSVSIRRGEIFGLLGPNGSGKTTTIKLLLGLINPTRGQADILGQPAGDQITRRQLGYLPEETYLYRFLNARQTLDFYARIFNMNRAQRVQAIDYYLDFVGLDRAVRKRRLGTYSKGQARRVGLAQALLNNPDLVILDEPTSGLDPLATIEMKGLIKQLRERGKTVLLSSHQLADVEDVCDRVGILYRGKLEVLGTVDELLEVKDVFKIEARNLPAEAQAQMVAMANAAGASEIRTGHQRSRLEDLFNRLVLAKRADERAEAAGQVMDITNIIIKTVAVGAVLAFVLLAYKDVFLLFTRPKTLGTGLGRIWAVGLTTMVEAWAAKAWVVPIIWFVACCIINLLSRAYDDTERISLYLRVLLQGQEFLCLVLLGVMACYSFPRERERRTVITTASKPLSRLEYFLGKVVGFCAVAALLLAVMTVLTWVFMLGANEYVKGAARADLAHQQEEYDRGVRGSEQPSPALRRAADEGELHAYDYIPATSMQIAGGIDYKTSPPTLLVKGGSQQKITYILGMRSPSAVSRTGLIGVPAASDKTPFFFFHFGYQMAPGATFKETPKITVHLQRADDPTTSEERTIALGNEGQKTYASWRVDDLYKFFWYDLPDSPDPGPLQIDVTCNSPDIYLRVYAGTDPNEKNVQVVDVDGTRIPGGQNQLAAYGLPILRGFEKGDTQQIEGPKLTDLLLPPEQRWPSEVASFRFHNVKLGDVPVDDKGNFTVSLQLDEDRMGEKSGTVAQVSAYQIYNAQNPFMPPTFLIDQKRTVQIKLPATLLDKTGTDLVVDIRCLTPKHWIGLPANGVHLDRTPSYFWLNLVKSEVVIFCECSLLILIGVTWSLRLGWPVAMLTTAVCYLLGNIFEYVYGLVKDSSAYNLLSFAESNALKGTLLYQIGCGLMNASIHMLYFCVSSMPNFTRFDAVSYIADSRSMPWSELLGMIENFGIYSIPFIAIGYLLIRKQELA